MQVVIFANKYLLQGNELAQITTTNGIADTISIGDSTTPNQLHLAGTNIFIASNTTSSGNISASKLLANDLTLVGLPDTSENKSLMIDSDGVVSGRTLGSNAFTTTTIGTTTNALTDGNGIADFTFNGSAGATVAIDLDGDTLTVGSSGIKISNAGVNVTQLHASVAGDGLAGGGGSA